MYLDNADILYMVETGFREEKTAMLRTAPSAGKVYQALSEVVLTIENTIGLTVMYIRIMLITHLTSGQFTVMIPLLAGLFPVLYLMMGALALPFRGRPMRRDQYMHSFIRVSRSCTAVIVCVILAQIAALIFRISGQNWEYFREDWLYTGFSLAVILVAAGTIFLLRSVDLIERENRES